MEEEKAAALYEELTRKGGGAARFKQGLGFSADATTTNDPPSRGSTLPTSSSSFLSSFVKASSNSDPPNSDKDTDERTKSQLQNIQNKLKKKQLRKPSSSIDRNLKPSSSRDDNGGIRSRDRSRSRSIERGRDNRERRRSRGREKRRSRSRDKRRGGDEVEESERERRRRYRSSSRERRRDRDRRSRSRSRGDEGRRGMRERGRGRSRSVSPRGRRSERGREEGDDRRRTGRGVKKEGSGVVDYAKLINGYDQMTPAERVKAKMKLQLSQTAEKDEKMGTGSQWEHFDFDKDAPVDTEELIAADDDAIVAKQINQSFRFASLEGKREDELRNAHDEAMFGVPAPQPSHTSENEDDIENDNKERNNVVAEADPASSLLNEKVLSKQQGSWRDRARRNVG